MSDCGRPVSCSLCRHYPVVNQFVYKKFRPVFTPFLSACARAAAPRPRRMASSSASSSDDAIRERSDNKEAGLWIHATSKDHLAKIRKEGLVRAHQNDLTSERYDTVLTDKDAPDGVWFNCHYMANGCLRKDTIYPESCLMMKSKGWSLMCTICLRVVARRWTRRGSSFV